MTRRQRLGLFLLVTFVLIGGTVYSVLLGARLHYGDEFMYLNIAENLRLRHWFSEDGIHTTAYRAPGYPFTLFLLRSCHVPIAGLRVFNFVALAGAVVLIFQLCRQQNAPGAGVLGGLMLAGYPVLFYTAGTLYPQTIGVLLLLLGLVIATRPGARARHLLLAGAVYGVLCLFIPSFLVLTPLFAVLPVFLGQRPRGRRALLYLAGAVLVIAPWTIRNQLVFGQVIPISTNGGINLLLGNSEHAGPDTGYGADISRYAGAARDWDEVQRDQYYQRAALDWIRAHPGAALRLYVLKVCNYFNFHNRMDTKGESSRAKDLLMLLTYGPLVVLLVVRLALFRRWPLSPFERFLVVVYLANALLSALFFTRIRFRLPFDALLICLVALFLQRLWEARRSGQPVPPSPVPSAFRRS